MICNLPLVMETPDSAKPVHLEKCLHFGTPALSGQYTHLPLVYIVSAEEAFLRVMSMAHPPNTSCLCNLVTCLPSQAPWLCGFGICYN